ncbi:trypco2 family protein [Kitasatospora sp. NPDC004531]
MGRKIGLTEAVTALHQELSDAVLAAGGQQIRFPVEGVALEFQVAVTVDAEASGKAKFWVLELGTDTGYSRETVQTVTLQLGAPLGPDDEPVFVSRTSDVRP